ncbi:hypothetical protein FEM48_Zijuj11G0024400 [Ziziphus jujuba var. spinosa]|nr:hypothetical protein FEM48_Zijuj11G0020800 [Ziziphus jujuba var. spinosa]KAH7513836.1 hypothetical protein FEM48_Zijuj11G0024400 [Ziziphus jujuba var. spinosa]
MSLSFTFLIFFTFLLFPYVDSMNTNSSDPLDGLVQDFASEMLYEHRFHSGSVYRAPSPANLSGVEVSIVRLRSRRLWNKGANFSYFRIPSRTTSVPHVKRLVLVYQNLRNWSSYYYQVPDYSFVTSVVGFKAFDASNVSAKSTTKISLNTMGKPILIHFPNLRLTRDMISRTRCVAFAANGTAYLSKMSFPGVCFSREDGHFSVVVPSRRKQRVWFWWSIGFVFGIVGLVLVGYVGMVSLRLLKTKKIQIMERQADEDLVLASRWVGGSKMPSATVTRTAPVLENGGFL